MQEPLSPDQPEESQQAPATPINQTNQINTPEKISIQPEQKIAIQLKLQSNRITILENELNKVYSRIAMLEDTIKKSKVTKSDQASSNTTVNREQKEKRTKITDQETLSKTMLTEAGVNEVLANDIAGEFNAFEMKKLELYDAANREGFYNTSKYYQELRKFQFDYPRLRSRIGDNAYDKILIASGRNNRTVITSVIPESPADQAGLHAGDIILDYAGKTIFTPQELKNTTTEGQRNTYVTLNVLRNNQPVSLLIPRGPFGVQIDATLVSNPITSTFQQ
ncbi:MAG: PDZ domain-containing protein [Gammaproteobacteria bacterium]